MPKSPQRLKIEGDWTVAAEKVVKAKKPAAGWPGPAPMPQRARKTNPKKK